MQLPIVADIPAREIVLHLGGGGHIVVRRNGRGSELPMHGSRKELGKGLANKILKDLRLK